MSKHRLLQLIRALPSGVSEIFLHPATGSYTGSAPNYRYRDELAALIDSEVVAACRARFITWGGYGDFMLKALSPTARLMASLERSRNRHSR
jgi:chitin disaccharide deacetylase